MIDSKSHPTQKSDSPFPAIAAPRAMAEGSRQLGAPVPGGRQPLLDPAPAGEAESTVWERYE
jgi:hypothetical protein